jgi:iron complex outermembrane receptor protein
MAVAAFVLSPVAFAQDLVLEEVTVTAKKTEVTLQDAAIAVSVTTGDDFDASNVMKLDNFNGYVPGLVVAKNDGAGRVVTIRGVGWETSQNLASQPSVLTYVDGIYLANPLSMGLDLGEVERVEVFRGPQGTEFGQGTTGGAINLVSKRPTLDEIGGYVDLAYGNYNTITARGAINVPLGSTAALRASVQRHKHDGFAEIKGGALDGYELDTADSTSARAALMWEPTDSLSIFFQGFVHHSDQNAAAQKNVNDPNPDARELTQDYPGIFNLDNESFSLIIDWSITDRLSLKSLTGYQELEKEQTVDGDRLTESTLAIDRLGFFSFDNWDVLPFWDNSSEATSQELVLSYRSASLDWNIGAYYLDHDNYNNFVEATGSAPYSDYAAAVENPSVETLPPFQSVLNFTEERTVSREDIAVYGQATFSPTERLAITAGIRWQEEEQTDAGAQFFGIFGPFSRETNDDAVTWKLGVEYNLSDDSMIYALASTGWKNGGTNPGAITGGAALLPIGYEPEEVTAFEVGARNTFLDGRARFNITAFLYDHEHLQYIFEDPIPYGGGTNTIAELKESGVETEFSFQISEAWRLDGMLAWQDGEVESDETAMDIIDFREALGPGIGYFTDGGIGLKFGLSNTPLKGNETPKMPDLLARLALTNTLNIGGSGNLISRIEYVHRGEMQARVFNNPTFDQVPSYDVVNLSFRYLPGGSENLSFGLTVSNATDEDGVNNIFNNPFGVWSTSEEYIPPRQVIGSVRYEF